MDEQLEKELVGFLNIMFSENTSNRPYWRQNVYYDSFFQILVESRKRGCRISGDEIVSSLREIWTTWGSAEKTEDDKTTVWNMFRTWDDWGYALEQLSG